MQVQKVKVKVSPKNTGVSPLEKYKNGKTLATQRKKKEDEKEGALKVSQYSTQLDQLQGQMNNMTSKHVTEGVEASLLPTKLIPNVSKPVVSRVGNIKSQLKARPNMKQAQRPQSGIQQYNNTFNNSKNSSSKNQQSDQMNQIICNNSIVNSNIYQKIFQQKNQNTISHTKVKTLVQQSSQKTIDKKTSPSTKMKLLLETVTSFLEEQKRRMKDTANEEPLTNYFEDLFVSFEKLQEGQGECGEFQQLCVKIKEVFEMPLGLIYDKMFKLQGIVNQQTCQIEELEQKEQKQLRRLQKQHSQLQKRYQENMVKEQRMIKLLNLIKQQGIDIESIYQQNIQSSLDSSYADSLLKPTPDY